MEADPLNSLVNVCQMDEDEGVAIQYVVRSSNPAWHYKVTSIVRAVGKGKRIADVIDSNI